MSDEKNSLLLSWKGSGVIGHLGPFSGNLCAKSSLPQYSPSAREELPAAGGGGREGGLSSAVVGAVWFAHNLRGQA